MTIKKDRENDRPVTGRFLCPSQTCTIHVLLNILPRQRFVNTLGEDLSVFHEHSAK